MTRPARLALLAAAVLLAGCFARRPVTRVADGETLVGRPIEPRAYAAYFRAELLAARGDARGALAELERARSEDPESPEILTRIAELSCGLVPRGSDLDQALEAFDTSLDLDPTYAPAWRGLSDCLARGAQTERALTAAERAAYYDPRDHGATERVARLLFELGRGDEAWRWLDALVLIAPESRDAQRLLLRHAIERRDPARRRRARLALEALGATDEPSLGGALDAAVHEGDLARARALAVRLGLRASALAIRLLRTSPELALEQATLVLAADPSDADAWIAALVATDRLGNEVRFAETARALDPEPLPPSPEALALLRELVGRRAGREAKEALTR